MKVNAPNAALNAFHGLKEIGSVLGQLQDQEISEVEAIEMIQEAFLEYQPQAAAYCVACELNGKDVEA